MPVTNYVWDPLNDSYLAESDSVGTVTISYTAEPDQFGSLISQSRDSDAYYFHYDQAGTLRVITNDDAFVAQECIVDAWGNELGPPLIPTLTQFIWIGRTGYYWHSEVGLTYVRGRSYSGRASRWLSSDRIPFADGINSHLYSRGNPLVYSDPSGNAASCNATCHSSNSQLVDTVARPGKMFWDLYNSDSGHGLSGVSSASFGYFYDTAPDDWLHRVSRVKCCCCCSEIAWVQVAVVNLKGNPNACTNFVTKWHLPPSGTHFIDTRMPLGEGYNPCVDEGPPLIFMKKYRIPHSFRDFPGLAGLNQFFAEKGTSASQEFQACVYCVSGIEGFVPSKFMVEYCCVHWGHRVFVGPTGKLKVERWINAVHKEWDFKGDDMTGQRQIGGKLVGCAKPTSGFIDAIRHNRIMS